jgi:hypothetical protein
MALINDAIGGLQRRFRSLFNTATGSASGSYFSRTKWNRGYIVRKSDSLKEFTFDNGYTFQFNPTQLSDIKTSNWETRPYAGLSFNDYVWSGGGERIVSFSLQLDDTPGSHVDYFLADAIAASIKNKALPGTPSTREEQFNQRVKDALGTTFGVPTRNTKMVDFDWDMNTAKSVTRVHERGVLDAVEYIQSFLYPEPVDGETPKFAEGGVIPINQFRPPAIAVFSFGPIFLEGVVKSAPVNYTLFDKDLTPIRAEVNVELGIMEFETLKNHYLLSDPFAK